MLGQKEIETICNTFPFVCTNPLFSWKWDNPPPFHGKFCQNYKFFNGIGYNFNQPLVCKGDRFRDYMICYLANNLPITCVYLSL